jgi:pyruvate kinase
VSASERAAALREQAERLDTIADLEEAAADAKAAYQADQNDRTKAAHRKASQALTDAREALRATAVVVSSGDGSTAVMPPPASGKGA